MNRDKGGRMKKYIQELEKCTNEEKKGGWKGRRKQGREII